MCRLDGRPGGPSPATRRALELIAAAGPDGLAQGELLAAFPAAERDQVRLAVGWLLKAGLLAW
jgi:hypothetical protein